MLEETNTERINSLFKMIDAKSKKILKEDPYLPYRQAVQKAKDKGYIRKKTQEEIDQECSNKPWLKVNKVIRKNEKKNYG
tara:strand:- start:115 stop:354 length:240 start_codon:yes stop_codon:yes gene_type:complete